MRPFGANGVAKIAVTESDNEFAGIQIRSDGKIVAAGHISNGLNWFSLFAGPVRYGWEYRRHLW